METAVQIKTEIERDGGFMPVEVIGIVQYSIDRNYGADADGNRGVFVVEINDIVGMSVWDENVNEVNITDNERDLLGEKLANRILGL